jgi:hypothetical protein
MIKANVIKVELRDDTPAVLKRNVAECASLIEEKIVSRIQAPKSGRRYRRRRKGQIVMHTASAPGEAPASDTGALLGSIQLDLSNPLHAVITIGAEYAELLEKGTRKMAARPYVEVSVEEAVEEVNGKRVR